MDTLLSLLETKFTDAAFRAYPQFAAEVQATPVDVKPATQSSFGDYQCNMAMKLTKVVGEKPRDIAAKIIFHLEDTDKLLRTEVAGPGFINIRFHPAFLEENLNQMVHDKNLGVVAPGKKKRIIVEFSSPNIAKELHVGHLRSTIIGDCLARLFEFLGHDVIRLNHIGDFGTQFGMLIAYMKAHKQEVLSGKEKTDLSQLLEWYKAANLAYKDDPLFKEIARKEVVKLQSGESESVAAWHLICDISRVAFQEIYARLDVRLTERGESFYSPFLAGTVQELEQKGLVTLSEGAKCVYLDGFVSREGEPLPFIIQKSDGGFNYATTDLAALKYRINQDRAERIIVITDAGQSLHFQMLRKTAEVAGWLDPTKVIFEHVTFGMVLDPDGKKFRTRSSETERLVDLLDEAINRTRKVLEERQVEMTEEEKENVSKVLGIGAIKYADLSCNRIGDYIFSYDRMLQFEGNTAAFLLYSYVRMLGIKRKSSIRIEEVAADTNIRLEHPSEIALGLHLLQFKEALFFTAQDLLPNRLTDYLFTLSQKFNGFFRDCKVHGDPKEKERLLLVEAAGRVLKQGLYILGLQTVERM